MRRITIVKNNNSAYGSYNTRTFSEIYENLTSFTNDFNFFCNAGLDPKFSNKTQDNDGTTSVTINIVYYLLLSKFANSHIAGSSEDQFKLRLFTEIYKFGPTWEKKLEIQRILRGLTEEDLLTGSKIINNLSLNPSTAPTTNTKDELPTINQQNVNKYSRNKLTGYGELWALLDNDVTSYFLEKFDKLFIKLVQPQGNLWYKTEINDEEDE